MKVIRVGSPSNVGKIRHFSTIEDLIIKNKPMIVLKEETEQKILNGMQELAEKRTLEEFETIELAKKIILNA